jgi:hypothetical protein
MPEFGEADVDGGGVKTSPLFVERITSITDEAFGDAVCGRPH